MHIPAFYMSGYGFRIYNVTHKLRRFLESEGSKTQTFQGGFRVGDLYIQ